MGALDDLIAQDNERQKGGGQFGGGGASLEQLIAMDEARNMPSQDPEIPVDEAPAFVGYDPASKPAPAPGTWDQIKSIGQSVMNPMSDEQMSQWDEMRARDLRDNGGLPPHERIAEAVVGSVLPGAGKGASLLKRAGVEAAQAMGMNAGDQANDQLHDPEKPFDIGAAARELAVSGGLGAAGGAVGAKLADIGGGIADWAGTQAGKAKNLVAGLGVRDAKAIAASQGVDAIDDYGRTLEKYSPSGITGKGADQHLPVIQRERGVIGDDLKRMAQEVNGQLAPGDLAQAKGALQQGLQGESARVANALPEDQVQYGGAIDQLQQRLGRKPDFESFRELISEKSGLQGFGHSGPGGSVPEGAQKQAAAYGGGVLKDEVSRIVGQMPPELRDRYVAQNQNFADLSGLEESLRNKAAAEAQGGDMGGILANSAISGLVGAGVGGLATDEGNKTTGILGGAAAGFGAGLGLQGGATRTAIRQGMGSRLSDAGGNMLRGIEGMARGGADYVAGQSAAGAAAGFADRRADAQEMPGAQVAVGHDRVAKMLRDSPEALGPFASLLQDAADDPDLLSKRITNLRAREPMFRAFMQKLEDDDKSGPSGLTFDFAGGQ